MNLPAECAEAAFALAHAVEHPEGEQDPEQQVTGEDMDSDTDETPKFAWDEVETELPKKLLELWNRASSGTQLIEVRRLLESHARVKGIPARASWWWNTRGRLTHS